MYMPQAEHISIRVTPHKAERGNVKMTSRATCRGEIHNGKLEVLVTVRHHQKLANVDVSLMKGHDMTDKITP